MQSNADWLRSSATVRRTGVNTLAELWYFYHKLQNINKLSKQCSHLLSQSRLSFFLILFFSSPRICMSLGFLCVNGSPDKNVVFPGGCINHLNFYLCCGGTLQNSLLKSLVNILFKSSGESWQHRSTSWNQDVSIELLAQIHITFLS